jgi:hypothetical protein
MNAISEEMQKDMLLIIHLQQQIRRINEDSLKFEPTIQNFLKRSSEFVSKYNPVEYTFTTDEQGKPKFSFSWKTSSPKHRA